MAAMGARAAAGGSGPGGSWRVLSGVTRRAPPSAVPADGAVVTNGTEGATWSSC